MYKYLLVFYIIYVSLVRPKTELRSKDILG